MLVNDKLVFIEEGRSKHEKELLGAHAVLDEAMKTQDMNIKISVTSNMVADYLDKGRLRGSRAKAGEPIKFKNPVFKKYVPIILSLKELFNKFEVNHNKGGINETL
jgi:phosphopantothenoylcysteine synthetase/decarboxylase